MGWRRITPAEKREIDNDGHCHVAVPLGIGDVHWAAMKLRDLCRKMSAPLCVHVNSSSDHVTSGYLRMIPFIHKVLDSDLAPFGTPLDQFPSSYIDDRYSTLEGSRGWNGLDFVFSPNGWVEQGNNIFDWMPELATEWDVEVKWTIEDQQRSADLMPEPTVLLYLSGTGPNTAFHGDTWTPKSWARLALILNREGVVPITVGAPTASDREYSSKCHAAFRGQGVKVINLVGHTSIPDYLLLIKRCSAWVGLNSGGGIVSASMGSPTLMFWADQRFPVGRYHKGFDPKMQRSWINPLDEDKNNTYKTLSYGSPQMNPERAAETLLEMKR